MIKYEFILPFSIRIVISFIFFTVVGTLTHELGHITVAKYYGYDTTLHYGSMKYFYAERAKDDLFIEYNKILEGNVEALKEGNDFREKERYLELLKLLKEKYPYSKTRSLWIALGGPLETLLTSFLGLCILYFRRSKGKQYFVFLDWLGTFMALFALREVFNFVTGAYSSLLYGKENFHGDEFRISRYLGMNEWIVPSIAFVLGTVISLYVIFKVIPLKYRFTFIISGLVGGVTGFLLWFGYFGKLVLP